MTLPTQQRDLRAFRRRLDIVLAHLDGKPAAVIARECETSRPTVRKWVRRFQQGGVAALLSEHSPGRPREVSPFIHQELVRLPRVTRPPPDIGDQWTTRSLGEVFGVSATYVTRVWQKAGFDPPQHLQQVEHNPDRRVPLRVELRLPAWFKLHLELHCRERDIELDDHILDALAGWDRIDTRRDEVLPGLRKRWTATNEQLDRVDPRTPEYRRRTRDAS